LNPSWVGRITRPARGGNSRRANGSGLAPEITPSRAISAERVRHRTCGTRPRFLPLGLDTAKASDIMTAQRPIDLYYWPTPNGWKISIMLEECGLPYTVIPVNIGKGDQFKPEFLRLSPNNKMPAITDPDGPGGEPISVFESGAILQYFGRKTGRFYPSDERARVEVEQWLMWQMGGFGPMLGQTHHFRIYAPEKVPYAIDRYTNESNRLYGVLDKRLSDREFVAGEYSIADMAIAPWAKLWERQGQQIDDFPNVKRWLDAVLARPAVQRGFAINAADRAQTDLTNPVAQAVLFGQKAR
jgi:GST-like protein